MGRNCRGISHCLDSDQSEYGLSTGAAMSLADVAALKERQLLKIIRLKMQHVKNAFQQCRDIVGRVV